MRAGKLEKAIDDPVDSIELLGHDALERFAESLVVELAGDEPREGLQGAQWVLDLVRQTGRQGAKGGEAIRAAQLGLQLVDDRDVLENGDDAEIFAFRAAAGAPC